MVAVKPTPSSDVPVKVHLMVEPLSSRCAVPEPRGPVGSRVLTSIDELSADRFSRSWSKIAWK